MQRAWGITDVNELLVRTEGQLAARSRIDALQDALQTGIDKGEIEETLHNGGTKEGDQECDHAFGEGVYARGLLIPAGTCIVGRVHQHDRVVIIAQGACTFVDEFHTQTVKAPWMGEFKAGSKTAVFAHSDTYWVAVISAERGDTRTLFEEHSCASHEDYAKYVEDKS